MSSISIPKLFKGDRFILTYVNGNSSELMVCETLRKVSDYNYRTDQYVAVNLDTATVAYVKGDSIPEMMDNLVNSCDGVASIRGVI